MPRQRAAVGRCLCLAVLTASAPCFAQDTPNSRWIDVNLLGVKSQQDAQTFTTTVFREAATVSAAYPEITGTGMAIEPGGGLRFGTRRAFGMGVHFDAAGIAQTVGLAATVPHPLIVGRSETVTGLSDLAERQPRAVDIQAVYFVSTPPSWSLRVFGGPTYFQVKEDRVSGVTFQQLFNTTGGDVSSVISQTVAEVTGSGWVSMSAAMPGSFSPGMSASGEFFFLVGEQSASTIR